MDGKKLKEAQDKVLDLIIEMCEDRTIGRAQNLSELLCYSTDFLKIKADPVVESARQERPKEVIVSIGGKQLAKYEAGKGINYEP